MKRYLIEFEGRERGKKTKLFKKIELVKASSREHAFIKLFKDFECFRVISVEVIR